MAEVDRDYCAYYPTNYLNNMKSGSPCKYDNGDSCTIGGESKRWAFGPDTKKKCEDYINQTYAEKPAYKRIFYWALERLHIAG